MAKMQSELTYEALKSFIAGGRSKTERKVANNTVVSLFTEIIDDEHSVEIIELRLHGNLIAVFAPSYVKITDAGWQSVTTKERLNHVLLDNRLGYLLQNNGQWYLSGEEFDGEAVFVLPQASAEFVKFNKYAK